ncbi:MAG: RecX family transcriptional regulator [Acetivibrionales bacterium]|jgi:regulatory protein|nr:RecX family transcriptional regulator [Bacillota bacterium]NLP07034.1 regulatory protein RecX [Clostridiaceae bacterium]HOA55615.1 RecX family transcriptional regulator [Clostridiales bacterium]HPZ05550.1 RecX family transcriptional regulator [Clostridiales bacterium]HQD31026.1 RecX family transcriptional regulator [Clostridiales bacterium]
MVITSIERSRKHKDKLSVFIDGKFSFTISEEDYLSLNLYEKSEITEETIEYIKNTVNFQKAKARAVRYLSLKIRTEQEVRDKLKSDGYDRECISRVIEELKAIGYINNKLYAQKYVFDRSKLKPMSKRMLKNKLLSKGIPEETADEVLGDWKFEDSDVARSLIKRKFGKYDLNDEKIKKKAYMFLAHRGFDSYTIREVLREFNVEPNVEPVDEV